MSDVTVSGMSRVTGSSVTAPAGSADAPPTVTGTAAGGATVTVRYFAAARAAAGTDDETLIVAADGPTCVGDVIGAAAERHGDALTRVLARCSYLLNATAVHDLAAPIRDGDAVDVLPPFAGG